VAVQHFTVAVVAEAEQMEMPLAVLVVVEMAIEMEQLLIHTQLMQERQTQVVLAVHTLPLRVTPFMVAVAEVVL
jgi:hypothetical protein